MIYVPSRKSEITKGEETGFLAGGPPRGRRGARSAGRPPVAVLRRARAPRTARAAPHTPCSYSSQLLS